MWNHMKSDRIQLGDEIEEFLMLKTANVYMCKINQYADPFLCYPYLDFAWLNVFMFIM